MSEQVKPKKGLAIVSLACGAIALVVYRLPIPIFMPWDDMISIIGIILGVLAHKSNRVKGDGFVAFVAPFGVGVSFAMLMISFMSFLSVLMR